MDEYITKDSGIREEFTTGSRRDTQVGKPRYDLIPVIALRRLADLYARGAEKYGDRNWERGQPISRYISSALRHMYAWIEGDESEDHAIGCVWNMFAIVWTLDAIKRGILPKELDDRISSNEIKESIMNINKLREQIDRSRRDIEDSSNKTKETKTNIEAAQVEYNKINHKNTKNKSAADLLEELEKLRGA